MDKKFYVTPEMEELDLEIESCLVMMSEEPQIIDGPPPFLPDDDDEE